MNEQPPITPDPEATLPKPAGKRKWWIVLILLLALVIAGGYALLPDMSCLSEPYTCFKFGNYAGGQQRDKDKNKSLIKTYGKFEPQMTQYGIRWYPTYVHFGPDGDTLLVSLCHVQPWRDKLCRIGKYSISKNHWVILHFKEDHTYLEPVFSPDGQWIVATMAGTIEGMGDVRTLRLVKMRPDGTGEQDLTTAGVEPATNELLGPYQKIHPGQDIQATGASFSHNGQRLIYWRQFNLREKDAPAFPVLYMLEWETGKETLLAGLKPYFERNQGRPFLTPDGERFVFSVSFADYNVAPEERDFVRKNNFFVANAKDAPVIKGELLQKLQVFPVHRSWQQPPLDMDRQGRVLYYDSLEDKKKEGNPVALGIRLHRDDQKEVLALYEEEKNHKAPLTDEQYRQGAGLRRFFVKSLLDSQFQQGGGYALFLRKPNVDTQDEVAFDLECSRVSLSPDGKQVACIWGGISDGGIGLLRHGEPMHNTRFIDWPKLDLIPIQPNSSKQH
ncbi:MAG: WD40-like Beta Propeller Repeat protein [Betaproteobacteria bacterium ADurb.Bin341]|nr:MAG: WD40-like Beta Propeller Repeat protein [Betaproteobacteria bacterium ADurb.Bin341]